MDKNVACEWWPYFQEVALSGTQPPLTDVLIKEVSLRAIWRWIQSSHSYAHQYCLCMRCHSQWIPKAKHILHTLDVCLPITAEGFLPRRQFFTDTEIWCDFHFFPRVCVSVYFVHVRGSRLQWVTERWEQKKAQAAAHDEQGAGRGGTRQVVNRCRKLQQQLLFHAPSIWAILKQMQRVWYGCCSWICMMWNYDASVIEVWLHNRRSSEIQSSRGWQHLWFSLKCNPNQS